MKIGVKTLDINSKYLTLNSSHIGEHSSSGEDKLRTPRLFLMELMVLYLYFLWFKEWTEWTLHKLTE